MGTPRFSIVVLCALLLLPSTAFAADLVASPSVIDKEAKPRDIIKGEVILKNLTSRKISVFPDVKDFAKDAGPASMTGWVELSRGVIDIEAGEQRSVPYLLHVNYDAKPGHYHAVLWFGTGSFRGEAEGHPERATEILMNVKVLDDAIERLQLSTFVPDRQVFPTEEAQFSFGLQNTGNRLIAPGGNLRIFDRRGREIAVVPVNTERKLISPEGKELLAAAWNAEGKFGRYKAVLDLEYGGQSKQITDTTFFWVLPWGKTLSLFTGISVAIVVITILLHARAESRRLVVPAYGGTRSRDEEQNGTEEADAKDAFLEKLRLRKEARDRAVVPSPMLHTPSVHHGPVHLSVETDEPVVRMGTERRMTATRIEKINRPREGGNVIRLSKK